MELNNTQHKLFLWHLDFKPFIWQAFYGEQCLTVCEWDRLATSLFFVRTFIPLSVILK